jgi:heat shock protein HtpX
VNSIGNWGVDEKIILEEKMARPSDAHDKPGVFESLYKSMSARLSRQLFNQVMCAQSHRPTLSLSLALAFILAGIMYLVLIALGITGIVLLFTNFPNPAFIFLALLCFALLYLLMPRLPEIQGEILSRQEFPALYQIADRVADALDAKPIDGIVLDWQFNAAFAQFGYRRTRILRLGLPLFDALEGQARVAVLAHELAHGVNGDPARGFFLGTALDMFANWYSVLMPDALLYMAGGNSPSAVIAHLGEWLARLAMRGFAQIPRVGAWVMVHLYWRDSQRAEYLADYLSTTVSGTDAMIASLSTTFRGGDLFWSVAQKAALNSGRINLFDELRRQIASSSDATSASEDWKDARIDATHPPIGLRIEFLQARRVTGARVIIPPSDWDRVERELMPFRPRVQEKLEEMYKQSLYY